ncbi:MAG: GAF domain-containing protein, partial [Anaerolineae bacterium]|nr:GAF domain-containing protein [Anaerolineae bacterium]
MSAKTDGPNILIIAPTDDAQLRTNLALDQNLTINYSADGQAALELLRDINTDLVILDAELDSPPAWTFLEQLADQQITPPVVLVGANGQAGKARTDFNYENIIGWINHPITAEDLASLIYSALDRPPNGDWVLTKRTELIGANKALTDRVRELDTLFEIGKSVTSLLELEAILHRVAEAAVELTNAEESYLLLMDETSGQLYLRAETNFLEDGVKDFWVPVNDSISGQVLRTGEPIIFSNKRNGLKLKTGLTIFSLINVPVKVGSTVIGVLGVNNRTIKRAFAHHEQELLSALADWAAIAIQNARLFSTAQEHNRDLAIINQINLLISGTLDVEQIPRLLIRRTTEIFEAECGSLALIDKERQVIIFQAAYDSEGREIKSMKDFLMPISQGIIGRVAQSGKPHVVNDVTDDPDWSPIVDQLTGFKTKKVIAVPLIFEGETIGIVELLNRVEKDFTQDDVYLLSLVASATAIALKNAQQYAALKEANKALKQAQAQRIASERWTVLGQAAGNLAHRINNSTTLVPIAVQTLQELLDEVKMSPDLRQEVDAHLDRIRRNTLYTVELATALGRNFRRIPSEAHDINALIDKALNSVEIPENIKVVKHLD